MKKSFTLGAFTFTALYAILLVHAYGWCSVPLPAASVRITGKVGQQLTIEVQNLSKYESVNVRATEVTRDTKYHGTFDFRGVPLKTLLQFSQLEKEKKAFSKTVDLAIVVRNKSRKQVVLSWGEIMFRNPGDAILAYASFPVMPYRSSSVCNNADVYKEWEGKHARTIGYPKLVLANDFYTERFLEEVVYIEVVDLNSKLVVQKTESPSAPSLSVANEGKNVMTIDNLSAYPRVEIMTKPVGNVIGYHGLKFYSGTPLIRILENSGVEMNLDTAFIVSSVDGYWSLLSYGELFLASGGERILVADRFNGNTLNKGGKFLLIPVDDLAADRNIKAIDKIEIVHLKSDPQIFVIGTGCADTSLLTMEALHCFAKADVFVCTEDQKTRFSRFIGDRPVLFDYFKYLMPRTIYEKELKKLTPEEKDELLTKKVSEAAWIIKNALHEGKTVAILEYGDPSIYGSLKKLTDYFNKEKIDYRFIPGISAFNAANALIGKEMACKGSILLTSYQSLKENEAVLQAIANSGDTLAIFMGLRETQNLIPLLKKYYPETVPVNFACNAGSAENNRLYRTVLGEAEFVSGTIDEKWLVMIYVGPCLK